MPDSTPQSSLRQAMLGAWSVRRRECVGDARFLRLWFYRDGRFGALSVDGRTRVFGRWEIGRDETSPNADDATRLTLHFDRASDPSVAYRLTFDTPPLGPMTLAEIGAGGAKLLLVRAAAIDAALIGSWQATADTNAHSDYAVDGIDLRRDGTFALRLAGGVVRHGHWSHESEDSAPLWQLRGTLMLDPLDVVFPVERWKVEMLAAANSMRIVAQGELPAFTLARVTIDALARPFVAHWRFVGPAGAPAPQELVFRHDGELELLTRPGTQRAIGRWSLQHPRRAPDGVEAVLVLSVHTPGHAPTREQWAVQLPFAPGAELRFLSNGKGVFRYRRLFR